jgi:hypothetical protein
MYQKGDIKMSDNSGIKNEQNEKKGKGFEVFCGIIMAVFGAFLVLVQLMGDNNNETRLKAQSKATSTYAWFNTKGIKQNLIEGERDTLKSLLMSGIIPNDKKIAIEKHIQSLDKKIEKYKKEKTEILLGSKKVGKANWVQDIDGQFGQVVGAKEWDEIIELTDKADNIFDFATLFMQLALIIGAISLIFKRPVMKWSFFIIMIALNAIGSTYALIAASYGTGF